MSPNKVIINFKVEFIDKIAINAYAESMNMSISEFCRLAVQEKLTKTRKEEKQESDTMKILNVLNSINNNVLAIGKLSDYNSPLCETMMGGFRTLCRGIIVTNTLKMRELKAVFPDKKIWTKLSEIGLLKQHPTQ